MQKSDDYSMIPMQFAAGVKLLQRFSPPREVSVREEKMGKREKDRDRERKLNTFYNRFVFRGKNIPF